jgi:hypothetical protein
MQLRPLGVWQNRLVGLAIAAPVPHVDCSLERADPFRHVGQLAVTVSMHRIKAIRVR